MNYAFRIFILLLFVFPAKAYSQNYCLENRFSQIALFDSAQIGTERNVSYGEVFNPFSNAGETLLLDLHWPLKQSDHLPLRPLVLIVHGGAFRAGSRLDEDHFAFELARRGYVSAIMDYRLGWNCPDADPCANCAADTTNLKLATYMAAQDIRHALRFLASNSVRWGIDPETIFVAGISAGSIAMYAAASWTQTEANRFVPQAENLLGPLNATEERSYTIRGLADYCGAFPGDSSFLQTLRLPVISFHDEFDCVVPNENGTLLGCDCSLFYPCCGPALVHRFLNAHSICSENFVSENSYAHCSEPEESKLLQTASFFKSFLCGACGTSMTENFAVKLNPVPADEFAIVDFAEYAHHGGTIHCYDLTGKEIHKQVYHEYDAQAILPAYSFSSGIYFLVFECKENPPPLKMLVVHQ